jgi:hypothetical protein
MKNGACKTCGVTTGLAPKADTFEADGLAPVHTQYTDAYVSSGLDRNLDDGLRRMADIRPEWVDKDCYKCGKRCIDGAIEGPAGTPEQGRAFCNTCFEKQFSKGNCNNCHQPVYAFNNAKWVKQDGKVFHDACFNEERRCYICRKPIFGAAVNALGRDYHENCFQCGNCQSILKGGSFFDFRGAPYCKNCIDEVSKTAKTVSKTSVPGGGLDNSKIDANNAKVAERQKELEDLKKFQHVAIGDKCSKCQKDILSNAINLGNGTIFHPACFVCADCGKGFDDMTFAEENGNLYHPECHKKLTAVRCYGCNLPIVKGKQVDYNGRKYHADCFKCTACSKGLTGVPFGEQNDMPYCESCMAKPQPKVQHGEYRTGFTVNPQGQKEIRGIGGAKIAGTKDTKLGGGDVCPGCGKTVFFSDQASGPLATTWHRACLKCYTCGKQIDSTGKCKDELYYCVSCYKKV